MEYYRLNYKQLFIGIQYYNRHYSHWVSSYQKLRKMGDTYWLHLERLNENCIKGEIIGFLNDWLCRVDYECAVPLKQILNTLPPLYAALKDEVIESIKFDALKIIKQDRVSNSDMVKTIIKHFLRVRPKFGPVAASKLMHMAIPGLFVMWDTEIRSKYRIPTYHTANHANNYVGFLRLMQLQLNHAIDSYTRAYDVNTQTAIQQIRMKDNYSTLARIVDKYNFAIRDGRLEICDQCYNKWLQEMTIIRDGSGPICRCVSGKSTKKCPSKTLHWKRTRKTEKDIREGLA